MATRSNPLSTNLNNKDVPLFADTSLDIVQSDLFATESPTNQPPVSSITGAQVSYNFNWIQAFFDATALGSKKPTIVVGTGHDFQSSITFAYSGERVLFRGNQLLQGGFDMKGNAITSLPINASSAGDSFLAMKIYGGSGNA
jgi:hypothetical protein